MLVILLLYFKTLLTTNYHLKKKKSERKITSEYWFDKDALNLIKKKNKSYRDYCKGKINRDEYKKIRNCCNTHIKNAKKKFFTERLDKFKNESRTLWSILNHTIRRTKN